MSKSAHKIEYDKDSQVLSWQLKKGKSVDSNIQGNVVIDYDKSGNITRINFYNFSFDDFKQYKPQFLKFWPKRLALKVR